MKVLGDFLKKIGLKGLCPLKQAPKRTNTRKKRKFHGNKYTKNPILTKPTAVENLETRSSKTIDEIHAKTTENTIEGLTI